ncbi:MAG: thioredoxin [Sneathiella sp.]|nr:MAG: thioredoxin [Sneathiella sp.]
MKTPDIVNDEKWISKRRELLAREKEFTRMRDELSAARRDMPWVPVAEDYQFDSNDGPVRLSELFGPHSQLVVYHFMYGPDWEVGCKSCSFWADSYDGIDAHLAARDVALVAISRTSMDKINAFRDRMDWSFKWVSSLNNSFNFDYHVSFTDEDQASGKSLYNFAENPIGMDELPGFSVFVKAANGQLYHSYSTYSRGLDLMNTAYNILDLVPKGRDEQDLPHKMSWLKLKDQY